MKSRTFHTGKVYKSTFTAGCIGIVSWPLFDFGRTFSFVRSDRVILTPREVFIVSIGSSISMRRWIVPS